MTGSKKNLAYSSAQKRSLIDWGHPRISIARQCHLLGLGRSSLYYRPVPVSDENLALMRLLDEEYTRHPFLGVIKLTNWLKRQGYPHIGNLQGQACLSDICRILQKPLTPYFSDIHAQFRFPFGLVF